MGGCFLRSQIDHPSMEAMRATWAHTWLRFKLQLDRCRDAAMEQSGPPFSLLFPFSPIRHCQPFPAPLHQSGEGHNDEFNARSYW